MDKRISYKDYYVLPKLDHYTGDIWRSTPTLGLLKSQYCPGIIITPACDLANHKVETLTYLPIVGIDELFVSRFFYPTIRGIIVRLSKGIENYYLNDFLLRNHIPSLSELEFLKNEFVGLRSSKPKADEIIKRIIIGLELTHDIINSNVKTVNKDKLRIFLTDAEYTRIATGIVRNSYASDLHFLPCDYEEEEWSKMIKHSVVLFRYPITAPIEIFECANDANCLDWQAKMTEISSTFPIALQFRSVKPLKTAKLHEKFLSDLLTRFVGLYMRLGSPDFEEEAIVKLTQEF